MSLRQQLQLRDGKIRPPSVVRKSCVHNGSEALEIRARGDLLFDLHFDVGRQLEVYTCIQCGYTLPCQEMLKLHQRYMLTGTPIVVGRNIQLYD